MTDQANILTLDSNTLHQLINAGFKLTPVLRRSSTTIFPDSSANTPV